MIQLALVPHENHSPRVVISLYHETIRQFRKIELGIMIGHLKNRHQIPIADPLAHMFTDK